MLARVVVEPSNCLIKNSRLHLGAPHIMPQVEHLKKKDKSCTFSKATKTINYYFGKLYHR
jgi:hypothetical protein